MENAIILASSRLLPSRLLEAKAVAAKYLWQAQVLAHCRQQWKRMLLGELWFRLELKIILPMLTGWMLLNHRGYLGVEGWLGKAELCLTSKICHSKSIWYLRHAKSAVFFIAVIFQLASKTNHQTINCSPDSGTWAGCDSKSETKVTKYLTLAIIG